MTEIDNWGEPTDAAKQKDAEIARLTKKADEDFMRFKEILDRYIDEKWKSQALIRELVALLGDAVRIVDPKTILYTDIGTMLAKAKAAGYEP